MTKCKFAKARMCGNYNKNSYTCNVDQHTQQINFIDKITDSRTDRPSYCGIYNELERANKTV